MADQKNHSTTPPLAAAPLDVPLDPEIIALVRAQNAQHLEWATVNTEVRLIVTAPSVTTAPEAIVSHGDRAYSAPGYQSVTVTKTEDKLLQRLMVHGTADHEALARIDSNPTKTLQRMLEKFPQFQPYINLPGGKGAGGYQARIIAAQGLPKC